jgi:hypothetical protein
MEISSVGTLLLFRKIEKKDSKKGMILILFSSRIASALSFRPYIYTPSICYPAGPAISTKCERVFSSAKRTITPERNRLLERVIEAYEYLKVQWRQDIITGATPGMKIKKRTASELDETGEEPPDCLIR